MEKSRRSGENRKLKGSGWPHAFPPAPSVSLPSLLSLSLFVSPFSLSLFYSLCPTLLPTLSLFFPIPHLVTPVATQVLSCCSPALWKTTSCFFCSSP